VLASRVNKLIKQANNTAEINNTDENTITAFQVLEKTMIFWHNEAQIIFDRLKSFKVLNRITALEYGQICKELGDARTKAVDCASKLINYQNPKLSNLQIDKKTTKRFVIVAPPAVANGKEWLEKVEQDHKLLPPSRVVLKPEEMTDYAAKANELNTIIEEAEILDERE